MHVVYFTFRISGADECSIFLYCAKGHFEEAVNLALNSNLELAKECAIRMNEHSSDDDDHADGIFPEAVSGFAIGPELTREYRRRVWLLIGQCGECVMRAVPL
jgi:hypothetical protein